MSTQMSANGNARVRWQVIDEITDQLIRTDNECVTLPTFQEYIADIERRLGDILRGKQS